MRASDVSCALRAILNNHVPTELASYVPPAATNAGLPSSSITALFDALAAGTPSALAKVPGITPSVEAAVAAAIADAYGAAYAYVYYAAIVVGLVGRIGSSVKLTVMTDCVTACSSVRDYDQYFTGLIPWQIYKATQADVPTEKKMADDSGSIEHSNSGETNTSMDNEIAEKV